MIHIAKIALLTKDSKVLVLKRSETHPKYPLHLDFPGGEVEAGEDVRSAIIREVKEETSISIEHNNINVLRTLKFSKDFQFTLCCMYLTDIPAVALSWEHSSFELSGISALSEVAKRTGVDPYFTFAVKELAKLQ
jgi:8-oxo-dGTP pyrophosphatase MutT (NUDIX family)